VQPANGVTLDRIQGRELPIAPDPSAIHGRDHIPHLKGGVRVSGGLGDQDTVPGFPREGRKVQFLPPLGEELFAPPGGRKGGPPISVAVPQDRYGRLPRGAAGSGRPGLKSPLFNPVGEEPAHAVAICPQN